MFIESAISVLLGVIVGTFTGLIPGIHINLVGIFLISLSNSIFNSINPLILIIFISSMAITHTFVDFIPSIFLGCPDTETQLSILPGHELLKEGKGYEAIMLTAYGGIAAAIILLFISFPLSWIISKIYEIIHSKMFWILLITSFILIFTERKKWTALFVFLISGFLGICVLNLGQVKEPLLPLLTGLFGSSMLIGSIKNKIQIPKQEITKPKCKLLKPIFGSLMSSPICGFLPGLGSGQAAVLGSIISKTDKKDFLVLIGATNVLVMGLSFVSLYSISKTRTGAAAAIKEIMGVFSWKILLILLITILISGLISFFITKYLAKFFSQQINKINYSIFSIITLIFLIVIVFIFSGIMGFFILIASTFVGMYFNFLNVKKTHMMGCLLIPTILYYGLKLI